MMIEQTLLHGSGGQLVQVAETSAQVLQNCTGICADFLVVVGAAAFTVGHTIFSAGPLLGIGGLPAGLDEAVLLDHELEHVRQYEILGDDFFRVYFGAALTAVPYCAVFHSSGFADCVHDHNILEVLAGPDH